MPTTTPHPDHGRLRLYRTYFRLTGDDPPAHRFTVWFHDVEPCHWEVGVRDLADARAARVGDAFGAFSTPPASVPPLPDAVRDLGAALYDQVRRQRPDARDVQVRYEGLLRELSILEETPWSDHGPLADRALGTARARFVLAEGETELRPSPQAVQLLGGATGFKFLDRADEPPRWIDFRLPPALEGTSLLTARFLDGSVNPDEWRRFSAAVLRAAAGETASLDDLLAAQGTGLLPPALAAEVTLRLTAYGRRSPAQESDRASLRFSLAEAARGRATARWTSELLGLQVEAELSLPESRLVVRATSRTGPGQELVGELLPHTLLRDGERVALRDGHLDVTFHPELRRSSGKGCSFTDDPRFSSVDLYVDGQLHARRTAG